MALNKEKYHLVGTPRVYCDVPSYLRAIGKKSIRFSNWSPSGSRYGSAIGNIGWDMNPVRQRIDYIDYADQEGGNPYRYYMVERIAFMEELGVEDTSGEGELWIGEPLSIDLRKLIHNSNYFGVLGHNMNTLSGGVISDSKIYVGHYPNKWTGSQGQLGDWDSANHTELLGVADGDGTYLATLNEPLGSNNGHEYTHGFRFNFKVDSNGGDPTGKIFELGAMTVGYAYTFPHSPNLSVSVAYSFDGIKRKRTMGGTDLTQINYLKSKWGKYAPFTTTPANNNQDFTDVSLKGRRIIEMSFDFISESDMFPKNLHQNTFVQDYYNSEGNYAGFEYDEGGHNANILGNYLNLTLGGNLTHILQLDSEQNDFVLVKLDGKATKITQKSPNLYSVKLKFIEQF